MQTVHIKNLERYNPKYTDRQLVWGKIYLSILHDPQFDNINEIDLWRFIAFILLELQLKKPVPMEQRYFSMMRVDAKKRPMSLTLQMLHTFIEVRNTDLEKSVYENRIEEKRIEEKKKDIYTSPSKEEFCKYITENKLNISNPESLWQGYEDGKWIDTRGKPVKNWKLKLRTLHSFSDKKPKEDAGDFIKRMQERKELREEMTGKKQ